MLLGMNGAVSQLRPLIAGFPPLRPGFDPKSSYEGVVVDKVTLRPVSPPNFHSTDCPRPPTPPSERSCVISSEYFLVNLVTHTQSVSNSEILFRRRSDVPGGLPPMLLTSPHCLP